MIASTSWYHVGVIIALAFIVVCLGPANCSARLIFPGLTLFSAAGSTSISSSSLNPSNQTNLPQTSSTNDSAARHELNPPINNTNTTAPLTIGVITWNMGEKSPTLEECAFINSLDSCDIIALGLQEIEDIKPRRKEGRRTRKWREIRHILLSGKKKKFECLAEHKLGGMHLSIYINKKAKKRIAGVQTIEVACGVGNVLSNKGAVCILLRLKEKKTLAFINAHLAAHQNKVS